MATTVDYVCVWYDGNENHLTRCTIDIMTGLPQGLPADGDVILIIEHDHGFEPQFFYPDTTVEMGIENTFP